jgi:hypothetical protein
MATVTAADLTYCIAEINRHRGMLNRPALTRSAAIDAHARAASEADTVNCTAHRYTQQTGFGSGLVDAENQLICGNIVPGGSVSSAVDTLLRLTMNEGPGGGHYENLRGAHTQVGCGIYVDAARHLITVTQNFK